MPSALESRLDAVYSEEPATRVVSGSARWPGGFGGVLNEVRSVVVHMTAGWPSRDKVEEFVLRYIGPPAVATREQAGVGPQFFVVGDGSAYRLIDMPSITWHAQDPINNWSIGVELANLGTVVPPQLPIPTNPDFDNRWRALGPDPRLDASDLPGLKAWLSTQRFRDAVISWWTTPTYNGPARQPLGNRTRMIFSDAQYRGWALLARYICEEYELPRNFPLFPHALRSRNVDTSNAFRRIWLADERFPMMVRELSEFNIQESLFANAVAFEQRYDAAIIPRGLPTVRDELRNPIWQEMFKVYRGFHGHGFSGAPRLVWGESPANSGNFDWINADHDCPGPLFDWHRFAREVWDWWWYPFDLIDDTNASRKQRPYRRANGDTPLIEYYFDVQESRYVVRQEHPVRTSNGIFDAISSPSTFRLEPNVPVYAPANGEMVAARFPNTGDRVSMAFVLTRHEVFHRPNTLTVDIEGVGSVPAHPGRIDYELQPSYVYSVVMHIGRPEGMSFTEITDANPDWLNRLLLRKKECDLAVARYDSSPNHGGVAQEAWESRPPGNGGRLSPIDGWRLDQRLYQFFLDRLSAGDVAVSQAFNGATPINIILGDFLGEAGVIRKEGTNVQHGIGLETFASGFVPPTFASHQSQNGWFIHPGGPTGRPPAVFYQTEWSKTPTPEERTRLEGIGVNPDLVSWWHFPALATALDARLPPEARLVEEGWAFHFRPLDFMRWINGVTWTSEWPKYQVKDAQGELVPMSPNHMRPRSRRV
jgi:hypothetical protein